MKLGFCNCMLSLVESKEYSESSHLFTLGIIFISFNVHVTSIYKYSSLSSEGI